MTSSSERISTPRATPSVAPAGASKAAPTGADDFAKTLTQARGSTGTATKSGAKPEPSAEEAQAQSAAGTSTPKSSKAPRVPRDSKETEAPSQREDNATSDGQLPGELAAALNAAQAQPAAASVRGTQESDAAAQSSAAISGEADRAALALASAANGVTVASPEASALASAMVGQNLAPASAAQSDLAAARPLPSGRLIATAGELRPNGVRAAQGAEQPALALVTDALQSAASLADGNAASGVTATNLTSATPDAAANAALSQLTAAVSSSDPTALTRTAPSLTQHTLHTPVGAQGWNDELATRLTWMVDQNQQAATLRLSPDNLGPVEVRIDVRDNQVSVWFGAAQADTRAAIESALPRLRELLQGQGLSLADAGVSQQSHRESSKHLGTPQGASFGDAEGGSEMSVSRRVGLFDGYA
jgi:flagellar hook-length control protein FliK